MQKHNLHRRQHHCRIRMLKLRHHSLTNMLRLLHIRRLILRQCRQERNPSPLRALVQRQHHLFQRLRGNAERLRFRGCLLDLHERGHRVRDDHGVGVADKFLEGFEEAVLDAHGWVEVEELGDAEDGCFSHVGGFVAQSFAEGLFHVIDHFVDADAAHCSDGEGAD